MGNNFLIVTDTGSDLPESYYKEHGVKVIQLGFMMDGVTYDGVETPLPDVKSFYAALRGGAMPKTFQATPEQVKRCLVPELEAGRDVLIVSFSSGLSGTYGSYVAAAKELMEAYPRRKVAVVDSLCASLGQGLFVDYLVKKAESGASLEETVDYAEGLKQHICHFFTVEDLYHLKRGGRVSAGEAFVGTVLNIKPVLHVDGEGHLIPIAKTMGRRKSISALVERMKELEELTPTDPIYISHGDCEEDVGSLLTLLKREFGEREVFVGAIGPVIGAHSGAGTLAVFFRGRHR